MKQNEQIEWGPWQDHDGHGLPVAVGTMVHRRFDIPVDCLCGKKIDPTSELISTMRSDEIASWLWVLPRKFGRHEIPRVIRYRVLTIHARKKTERELELQE